MMYKELENKMNQANTSECAEAIKKYFDESEVIADWQLNGIAEYLLKKRSEEWPYILSSLRKTGEDEIAGWIEMKMPQVIHFLCQRVNKLTTKYKI